LEKAFHRVPIEVIGWAKHKLAVEEWLVSVVMSMYTGAKTVIRTVCGNSNNFSGKAWYAPRFSIKSFATCHGHESFILENSELPYHGSCCMQMTWLC